MRVSPQGITEGDFIRDPDHWPAWPCLPMKQGHGNDRRIGFLWDSSGGLDGPLPEPVRIYLANMFTTVTGETPCIDYPTVDDLLGAGWEVD